jgi:hypothetical protein
MNVVHDLKCYPQYFKDVRICPDGEHPIKPFEVRKDDRPYNAGDVLHLREFEPTHQVYTGNECWRTVTYILRNPEYVKEGYCIMGIRPTREEDLL